MRCQVTRLRDQGRRLKRSELQPPQEGDLSIFDRLPGDEKGRVRLQAELKADFYGQVKPNVFQPIFDVQVLKIDATGMYVQGVEIHPQEGGAVVETIQVWHCQPSALIPPSAVDSESVPGPGA
ncbi:MAG: hypothetical protein KKD97_16320 [Gammaproteobacteria bacterium]|nr:hypothetical protein [Gammaproteobacteria bacterium]